MQRSKPRRPRQSLSVRCGRAGGSSSLQLSQQDLAVISATALAASHLNRTLSGSGHHPSHLRLGLQLLPASQTEQPGAAAAKFKVLSIVTC